MQIKDVRPQSFTKRIRCDRCIRVAELGDMEFNEFVSIERTAGYVSVFGDGNQLQLDLCQHCVKDVLGSWLRILEPAAERPRQLDTILHGGVIPTDRNFLLRESDKVRVQDCMPFSAPSVFRQRLASLRAFFHHSVRLYFAPLTGAVRGISREYRRLERMDRERRRLLVAADVVSLPVEKL